MLEGSYLYYDLNNEEWIRSGKAVGSNFSRRHAEHKAEARLKSAGSDNSKFYNSYPSMTVDLPNQGVRKGEFENLEMLVGVGFNKLLKGKLVNDIAQGGIFHFDSDTVAKIDKTNFRGNHRLQAKQLNMLGYLWELAYDLCIAPESNISGNPGFEVLLGVF